MFLFFTIPGASPDLSDQQLENKNIGKRIYREGIGSSGQPVVAISGNDVVIDGEMVTCESCHKRSGLGSSESRQVTPPVIPDYLFKPRERGRRGTLGVRTQGAGTRPSYTDESLKAAIVLGVDPVGRSFNPLMPRYHLSERDLAGLLEYLKSKPSIGAPGISDKNIHFATVVAGDVSPQKKKAMLDVFQQYLSAINTETRQETRRAEGAPWHRDWKYKAYRKWALHVWELKGNERDWPAQLTKYYNAQPVFAMLGGVGAAEWKSVHAFCESNEIPCLFPHTEMPVLKGNGYYTLYFSRGLALEGEVAVKHLQQNTPTGSQKPNVLQIHDCFASGRIVAEAVEREATYQGLGSVTSICVDDSSGSNERIKMALNGQDKPVIMMLWLERQAIEALSPLFTTLNLKIQQIYISSKVSGTRLEWYPSELGKLSYVVHSSELVGRLSAHLMRTRGWLQNNGIESFDYRHLQADTFFSLMITRRAVKQMREKFSRDYFIEILEHSTEKILLSSVYPRLSLGPGQRFASKGSYVLSMSEFLNQQTTPSSVSWVVP